ncbi:MAG TPA: response regulator [Polyangia bacterium]|nr:response regulator [Polyangia bacterium]
MLPPREMMLLRREIAVVCAANGTVEWADPCATLLVGLTPGTPLTAYAVPGTADKVTALVRAAQTEPVEAWEASLLVRGRPATFTFRGAPVPEQATVMLVGDVVSHDVGSLRLQRDADRLELASLQDETTRQQQQLVLQNQELLRLNHHLDDSTRGMIALHAEVDEKNDSLRRLSEVKSRVIGNVSHEFRTPLNSIIGLAKMMMSETDGPLTAEQRKQLTFIRSSAESLSELVNDLLDLSKIEAGRVSLRPVPFQVDRMFAGLRGMMRPLLTSDAVEMTFDAAPDLPPLNTDEGKVFQILKNFLSNAIKFTERGSIRVTAARAGEDRMQFAVTDTGIGIRPEDQSRVFDEFSQIENPLQDRVKGTGLGLSISRHLAGILGGRLWVDSQPGVGSTFTLDIPLVHPEVEAMQALVADSRHLDPNRAPVLVVEDDRQTLFLYERYLRHSGFQVIPARSIEDAREAMKTLRPAAVVLDIMLDGETSWSFLADLKANPATSSIPALVVTVTNREAKARALGADEFFVKPVDQEWLIRKLSDLARRTGPITTLLVIDDDEVSRYMLRRALSDTTYRVVEAPDGATGVRLARTVRPQVIFLDLVMPGMAAFDVIDELKLDPRTRGVPIIIHSSKVLADDERRRLQDEAAAILPKQDLNREVALARIREALVAAGAKADDRGVQRRSVGAAEP